MPPPRPRNAPPTRRPSRMGPTHSIGPNGMEAYDPLSYDGGAASATALAGGPSGLPPLRPSQQMAAAPGSGLLVDPLALHSTLLVPPPAAPTPGRSPRHPSSQGGAASGGGGAAGGGSPRPRGRPAKRKLVAGGPPGQPEGCYSPRMLERRSSMDGPIIDLGEVARRFTATPDSPLASMVEVGGEPGVLACPVAGPC